MTKLQLHKIKFVPTEDDFDYPVGMVCRNEDEAYWLTSKMSINSKKNIAHWEKITWDNVQQVIRILTAIHGKSTQDIKALSDFIYKK